MEIKKKAIHKKTKSIIMLFAKKKCCIYEKNVTPLSMLKNVYNVFTKKCYSTNDVD